MLVMLLALPGVAGAQTGVVVVDRENFRAAPGGAVIAEILRGTELRLGDPQERWRQATVEGWIWSASVREDGREGHDLVVGPADGENLRAAANGDIVARLRGGMLLERLGQEGNWVHVRRTAWIWTPSLRVEDEPAENRAAAAPAAGTGDLDSDAAGGGEDRAIREFATTGAGGLVLLTRPAGDTVARVRQGAAVQVLAREGSWTRVRVDGWTFTAAIPDVAEEDGVLRDLPRSELTRDPDRFRGRLVEWSVQFIALQQAERFRTDFMEDEPFILARGPGEDAGFVYLAVPGEWLEAARRLAPLQRIRVLGRIRTAMSGLTEAPVVDLLDIIDRPAPPH